MALDHFVSQVHLRNFYSPALGKLMHAIRKSDLKAFRCNSASVCRIEEGNTNSYLLEDRAIEDFLRCVEPKYNTSLAKLRANQIDRETIQTIAGFAAYVASSSPGAMRVHTQPLRSTLEVTAQILDQQGRFGNAPESLGNKTLTELLGDGTVGFKIDPKYPQALGVETIVSRQSLWGNSHWDIIVNEFSDAPFFTSDFPIAIEPTRQRIINWIVPLAPDLAIRIVPDIQLARAQTDLSFSKFNAREVVPARSEIVELNRIIVRCAEDLIFYRDDHSWVVPFVAKNRHYHVECVADSVKTPRGFVNVFSQRVIQRTANRAA